MQEPFEFFLILGQLADHQIALFLAKLADPLFLQAASNMGPQILMKVACNYIASHKYGRGAWNLPHKFHLYLIIMKKWNENFTFFKYIVVDIFEI